MSVQIEQPRTNLQAPAVELSKLGVDVRSSELQEASVGLLEASRADSARLFALLGAGPEVPGAPGGRLGGRSYTELMVEVQKALAQMSFDTKIVNREQSVTYGKAKADTIDDGADKIRLGATVAYAMAFAGAVINIGMNAAAYNIAFKSKPTPDSQVGKIEINAAKSPGSLGVEGGAVPPTTAAQGSRTATDGSAVSPEPGRALIPGGDDGAAGNSSNAGANTAKAAGTTPGNDLVDARAADSPDGLYVSQKMNILAQVGAATSTIVSGGGDLFDKHQQADKMEFDADGQLFDTYAGEQSQFYSDANQNTQRALGLISSFVGQIYNTNTSIIASLPR